MITSTPTLDWFDDMAVKYHNNRLVSLLLGIGVLLAYPVIWIESKREADT